MNRAFADLLAQHNRGVLTLDALHAQLRTLAARDATENWPGLLQAEVAAGRISQSTQRAVLATLADLTNQTAMMSDRTFAQPNRTMVRKEPEQADVTEVNLKKLATPAEADDQTKEKIADETVSKATLLRPASSTVPITPHPVADDNDRTQSKAIDATLRTQDEHTQRAWPVAHDPVAHDPTERKRFVASDLTERKSAASDVTERKQRVDHDLTEQKSTGATAEELLRASMRDQGGGEDATQRKARATLNRAPERVAIDEEGHTATQQSVEPTQLIVDRVVKASDDDAQDGHMLPGAVIKQRFVLESMIGKGGMGLVFAAIDRRKEEAFDSNPRVALKVLNADFRLHPQSFIALQREARKAQSLAHPNVVTVFDFDRDGQTVYMTMELLQGQPLEKLVREARGKGIGRDVALPIVRGIAEGLAYAHRKGIVHSDLKPGNVFILDDRTPKILDFGIARAVPSVAAQELPDIFDAGALGAYTEAYATDEMVDGIDPHPADDMYALGVIAYELLTGFHPYQRNSAPKARKLGLKPPPLKGLRLREARALERCLSLDRKLRPQSAGEFLKLFRGVTTLQKTTIAASVVFAIAAAYFSYENYRETSPSIPFSQLPVATQQQFAESMTQGDAEWRFFERDRIPAQLQSAVVHYANAYALHPRNRDATNALRKSGDALLAIASDDEERQEVAETLQNLSDFFRKYEPTVEAAR